MCVSYEISISDTSSLLDFIDTVSDHLTATGRPGSACAYRSLAASLRRLMSGARPLGQEFVRTYAEALLRSAVCRNTLSFYMRLLRTALNRAYDAGGIDEIPAPWFRGVYTGFDRTRKRAVSVESMRRIASVALPPDSRLALARDIFMFCFYARGMAFVDAIMLTRDNITDRQIEYCRRKTGRRLRIGLHDKLRGIICLYASPESVYVFPVLGGGPSAELYRSYRSALGSYNLRLKRLAAMAGVDEVLTSYTPRHSWATIARDHDVPIKVISEGMGHDSELTTRIYLASIADSEVDRANGCVADLI